MPKLWDYFPKELIVLIKPTWRGFYSQEKSIEKWTGKIKKKYKIYCDFFSNESLWYYIFTKTTSNDLRMDFKNYYCFNIVSDINFIKEWYKKWLEEKWYIYIWKNNNPIDIISKDEFHSLAYTNNMVHLGYFNNRTYKNIAKFLKDRRDIILRENNVNIVINSDFKDKDKKQKVKEFLSTYIN